MNDTSLDIARRLNDAPRMFWWEIDVALIFLGSMLAGMLLGLLVSGAALGVLLAWAFGKAKSGEHPAFALHLLYWHLPQSVVGLKRTPPSHQRDLVG